MDKPAREFQAARAVVASWRSLLRANRMTATIAARGRSAHWRAGQLQSCVDHAKAREIRAILSLIAAFWLGMLSGGGMGGGAIAFTDTRMADGNGPATSEMVEVPRRTDGHKASFALNDLAGVQHDLSNMSGHLVLVHFFATWCEPCREELPALQRLSERSEGSALAVFAISVGEPDERVRRFFETNPLKIPVVLDRDREVAKKWRIETLPTTYVLDPELEPRLMVEGEFEWDRVKTKQLLDAVLSARQNKPAEDVR
jgi:thiol-disulfide isomerase/thioredoxin